MIEDYLQQATENTLAISVQLKGTSDHIMNCSPCHQSNLIFTIGHSNHSVDRFIALLRKYQIEMVADVRSIPYSRYVPHFNKKTIQTELLKANIKYIFLGKELGGKPQQKGFYNDNGCIQYDRIAKAPLFQQGIQRLNAILTQYRTAILCSEENPAACHRQILIGNHFCDQGFHVYHIRGSGRFEIQENGDEKGLPNLLDLND